MRAARPIQERTQPPRAKPLLACLRPRSPVCRQQSAAPVAQMPPPPGRAPSAPAARQVRPAAPGGWLATPATRPHLPPPAAYRSPSARRAVVPTAWTDPRSRRQSPAWLPPAHLPEPPSRPPPVRVQRSAPLPLPLPPSAPQEQEQAARPGPLLPAVRHALARYPPLPVAAEAARFLCRIGPERRSMTTDRPAPLPPCAAHWSGQQSARPRFAAAASGPRAPDALAPTPGSDTGPSPREAAVSPRPAALPASCATTPPDSQTTAARRNQPTTPPLGSRRSP